MNAQREWKRAWRRLHHETDIRIRANALYYMQRMRREAALERQIAAQQRRIEQLEQEVWEAQQQITWPELQ